MGLLIVLALSAIAALADRDSQSGQLGSGGAQAGAQALPASLGSQAASLPSAQTPSTALPAGAKQRAADAYAKLPLAFTPNAGQTDSSVRYYAQGAGYSFYFTDHKAVLALQKGRRGEALHMRFLGANPNAKLKAADRGTAKVNYLTGSEHHTNLPTYGRLIYRNLWPGIDMVFRGQGGKLSYEFRLRPGADPSEIRLAYAGAKGVSLGAGGALLLHTPLGTLKDARPQSFQRIDGRRVPVDSRYAIAGNSYGFSVGHHDRRQPLVIDPSLAYSTYLGGSGADNGSGIAVDSAGAAYITGTTAGFPTTAGAFDTSLSGFVDAFVTKLNPAGSGLAYSTYLGGSGSEQGQGIAVDSAGAAYVTGFTASNTSSNDFPTTAGAFDTSFNGGEDAFVTKLNPAGSGLAYSTYLGGSSVDNGYSIAVDSTGAAYVTGTTSSTNFPTTAGAFDTSYNGGGDAFVTKLNAAGSGLAYSTYLGGSGADGSHFCACIAVDSAGAAYVTGFTRSTNFPTTAGAFDTSFSGSDAFVTKLNPAGSGLTYSTYLGGTVRDEGQGIAVDSAGAAYVTGFTESTDFPTTAGAFDTSGSFDAFVTKLNPAGSGLAYSTYLGGAGQDVSFGIAVDSAGAAYVTGTTSSTNFPTTAGAFDTSLGGFSDAFVTKLNPAGSSLAYSTYLGGSNTSVNDDIGFGIAVDSTGAAYVTGRTSGTDFPTTAGAFDTSFNGNDDAFVTKLPPLASLAHSTATSVSCSPGSVSVGNATSCTATVTDTATGTKTTPSGTVSFSSNSSGSFSSGASCTLSGSGASASCQLTYTPSALESGTHQISASYGGDTTHATSSGNTNVTVTPSNIVFEVAEQTPAPFRGSPGGVWAFGQGASQGNISARGTVHTAQGPTIAFSAITNCNPSQSTRPSIVGTPTGGVIWKKTTVIQSSCTDQPPASTLGFDTQTGTATGTFGPSAPGGLNGQQGTLEWTYYDDSPDTVQFTLVHP